MVPFSTLSVNCGPGYRYAEDGAAAHSDERGIKLFGKRSILRHICCTVHVQVSAFCEPPLVHHPSKAQCRIDVPGKAIMCHAPLVRSATGLCIAQLIP